MSCKNPKTYYRIVGKKTLSKDPPLTPAGGKKIIITCNQCMGCRLAHQSEWVSRISDELKANAPGSSLWITLTYNDEHLPTGATLLKEEIPKFIERLRYQCRTRGYPDTFRYLFCGEYGEQNNRCHYHGYLFGLPQEIIDWVKTQAGIKPQSKIIESAWGKGFIRFEAPAEKTISYSIKYTLKKKSDTRQIESYYRYDSKTGHEWVVQPEFMLCSRRPGIGRRWFERYFSDFMPSGTKIINGAKVAIPKSYRRFTRETYPAIYEKFRIASVRRAREKENHPDNTPERLETIDLVKSLRFRGFAPPRIRPPVNLERRKFIVDELVSRGYLPESTDKEKLYTLPDLQNRKGQG